MMLRHLTCSRRGWLSSSGFGLRVWILLGVLMVEVRGRDSEDDAAALHFRVRVLPCLSVGGAPWGKGL